jgi:hypothetical protein
MSIDEDSSCSSGDDILNFTVMSQPSPAKAYQIKDEESDEHDLLSEPKKHAGDETGNTSDCVDEAKALHTATSVIIDKNLESPSNLYWRIKKKGKAKTIYPVRIPPQESEYIGYRDILKIKDHTRQTVVQYVQFPHAQIKSNDVGLYDVVSRNQLVPYHGETKDAWCPTLSKQYFQQLRRKHKELREQQIRVEELYLERVLQKAKEDLESTLQLEQFNVAAEEPEELKIEEPTTNAINDEIIDEDSDRESQGRRCSKRRKRLDEDANKEWLHVGDIIQFYKPNTLSGVPENLCQATIVEINPRKDPMLTVECPGEFFLIIPNDHHVMRIKRMDRGMLVNCIGRSYYPVSSFTSKREGDKNAARNVMNKRVDEVKRIVEKTKQIASNNISKDGWGPTDVFR